MHDNSRAVWRAADVENHLEHAFSFNVTLGETRLFVRLPCGLMILYTAIQVIHRLSSPNVLKFYDWYETRNNVWLILEFCTGGDLLTLIKQVRTKAPQVPFWC